MSLSAATFSSLVREAGQLPDVRSDLVASFKSRIQAGTYPTEATLDGLTRLMGGTWARENSGADGFDY